jgi:hypothetical protein
MGRHSAIRVAIGGLVIIAVAQATNAAFAQNPNGFLTIFGGDKPRAPMPAQAEWRRLPLPERSCIDQRLRHKGSSVEALILAGVKPSAPRLVELRSSCREVVHHLQAGPAPAVDATGSPRTAIAASNPTESKDARTSSAERPKDSGIASTAEPSKNSDVTSDMAPPAKSSKDSDVASSAEEPPKETDVALLGEPSKEADVVFSEPTKEPEVTPPIESPKDSEVTPPAQTPNGSSVTLPQKQTARRVAEELVQQVKLEPKSSEELGIRETQSAALLFAVAAIAGLFAVVMQLFVKWRNTIRSTAAEPEKTLTR